MIKVFLYYCEKKWVLQTKNEIHILRKAQIISDIFRFIDDLCKFNNDEF